MSKRLTAERFEKLRREFNTRSGQWALDPDRSANELFTELDRLRAQAAEIERWQRFFSLVKEYATNPDSMRQKWGDWLNIPWVDSILAIQRERDAQLAAAHFIPGQSVAGPGFAAHLAEQIRKGT